MYQPKKIQAIPLQNGEGRHLRYVLQPLDLEENDPFILLADDQFAHNTFADHPHKGIQTVTYVLQGSLTHYDSKTGGGGKLQAGDFQVMTAGRGIIHNENPDRGEEVRVAQLWVNLSSEHKKADGGYQDLVQADAPTVTFDGGEMIVYAGQLAGVTSPLQQYTPFIYAVVNMEAHATYELAIPTGYNTYAYVLEGAVKLSGEQLTAFDMAHFGVNEAGEVMTIQATEAASFILFAGQPIEEPVVARGPFVMNTEQEIREAYESYRNGTFLDGTPY